MEKGAFIQSLLKQGKDVYWQSRRYRLERDEEGSYQIFDVVHDEPLGPAFIGTMLTVLPEHLMQLGRRGALEPIHYGSYGHYCQQARKQG